ncbi:MAG TPA: hypothetical protein VF267_07005 [Gammaproteobacteria bacterium]
MRVPGRWVLLGLAAVSVMPVVALAYGFPGTLACAAIDVLPFRQLGGGMYVPEGGQEDAAALAALRAAARSRIETAFGAPRANPAIVFIQEEARFSLGAMGDTASSYFTPARSCIVVGAKGRSVDVLAHELMHAELAERVGFFARMKRIPVWFDEGLAMQVDHRRVYSVDLDDATDTTVREYVTYQQFFDHDDGQLVQNYRAAKAEVARWLRSVGNETLYASLERIRSGETVGEVTEVRAAGVNRGVRDAAAPDRF